MEGLGCRTIQARYEHCAVSMATSAAEAKGTVGLAPVTCGPGLTRIMTALATAVRVQIPLVVFAGEAPVGSAWHNQEIGKAPFVTAAGATYILVVHPPRLADQMREAFLHARLNRCPAMIGAPFDLQAQVHPAKPYTPFTALLPGAGRIVVYEDHAVQDPSVIYTATVMAL